MASVDSSRWQWRLNGSRLIFLFQYSNTILLIRNGGEFSIITCELWYLLNGDLNQEIKR